MPKVTPIVTRRLENSDRTLTAQLRKGVQCELPPALFAMYQELYGDTGVEEGAEVVAPVEKQEVKKEKDTTPNDILLVIASAINEVMEEGDTKKLTVDGEVRTDAIASIVGFKVTAEQRDAAMELV